MLSRAETTRLFKTKIDICHARGWTNALLKKRKRKQYYSRIGVKKPALKNSLAIFFLNHK